MNDIDIKAELAAGTTPRALNEMVKAQHRREIEAAIAEGKWKCPQCRAPMQLRADANILFCGRHHEPA